MCWRLCVTYVCSFSMKLRLGSTDLPLSRAAFGGIVDVSAQRCQQKPLVSTTAWDAHNMRGVLSAEERKRNTKLEGFSSAPPEGLIPQLSGESLG